MINANKQWNKNIKVIRTLEKRGILFKGTARKITC